MLCDIGSPPAKRIEIVGVDQIDGFDEIIDVRSPGEFAEDHIPGAINLPVLDDAERARVGTDYKQVSAFEAKKIGAALVSRNIARHLETHFADKPKKYRPLVYCWRGGNRSGALAHVLRSIGWPAAQLDGGYKAYRKAVMAELASLPGRLRFVVICGRTGSGKSRFLLALREAGAQALDLEDLAAHKGSVLGGLPDRPQPSQKYFESLIRAELHDFDPARPVFVESESKKIGRLHMPDTLLARMRSAECLTLEADIPTRVALLKEEYAHFLAEPQLLNRQLDCLVDLQGHERIERWKQLALAGQWDELVAELLVDHYDPAYNRSLGRNYPQAAQGPCLHLASPQAVAFQALSHKALQHFA
ncbi:tRNA 2-selenouridine synthase [Sulfuritortus calidifontis]|uniref:tRNA 2-selenouridine synthase n=1 Tax=Sulfuritortus calidifontis TaxID=1914471 RepID=A0A4R3JWM8_9PROT|nr:tRNA 2-selenouridine(34) synthase MnmH [Sulfuritortus calidifontis]TCS71555.1 tRNA 2-selenouridine synthase [Sulfuritortus calidifontis]